MGRTACRISGCRRGLKDYRLSSLEVARERAGTQSGLPTLRRDVRFCQVPSIAGRRKMAVGWRCAPDNAGWSESMGSIAMNGTARPFEASADTPLLWVLRDVLGMTGTKFGCGIAQCGACTVHLDGKPTRSCVLPVGAVGEPAGDHHRRHRRDGGRRAGPEGLAGPRSDPVRLLPVRPDHGCCRSAGSRSRIPTTPTSMPRSPATSADAAPTSASARRSRRPRPAEHRESDMGKKSSSKAPSRGGRF